MVRSPRRPYSPARRRFLQATTGGAVLAVGGGAALAGCSNDDRTTPDGGAGPAGEPARIAFHGPYQRGVVSPAPAAGIVAALDVEAAGADELVDGLRALTAAARDVMDGPPSDAGTGPELAAPADLSVIVGAGTSLFDERFGIQGRKPRELREMEVVANDELDPALVHGDLSLTVAAASADVAIKAFRHLLARTDGAFRVRWMQEGFNTIIAPPAPGRGAVRNLQGFKDGSANLDPSDDPLMDELVWVGAGDDEPPWATGGSYQVVRIIRMHVEAWDRADVAEQEAIIGRHKDTGAPLGYDDEAASFDYVGDPDGRTIPLDSHIRLANPRTPETDGSRILRRAFSYARGVDTDGRLDQGLLFSSFQASLDAGFSAVQERLKGEPLERFTLPIGGGYFFVLPGVEEPDGFLGEGMFT